MEKRILKKNSGMYHFLEDYSKHLVYGSIAFLISPIFYLIPRAFPDFVLNPLLQRVTYFFWFPFSLSTEDQLFPNTNFLFDNDPLVRLEIFLPLLVLSFTLTTIVVSLITYISSKMIHKLTKRK